MKKHFHGSMKVAYIAGPFRGEHMEANIRKAGEVAEKLWNMGYAVICPHLNSGSLYGKVPEETVLEGYLEMVRRSDLVVLFGDWWKSEGAKQEAKEAIKNNIPVTSNKLLAWKPYVEYLCGIKNQGRSCCERRHHWKDGGRKNNCGQFPG